MDHEERKAELEVLLMEAELLEKNLNIQRIEREDKEYVSDPESDKKRDDLDLLRIEIELKEKQIALTRLEREEELILSGHDMHLTYTFYDSVNDKSVKAALHDLGVWSRRAPGKPIKIILNSPGGGVTAGLALYDYIRSLSALGHHITVFGLGEVSSMGSILTQAGDKRILGKGTSVLIHEVSHMAYGSMGQVEDDVVCTKKMWDRLVDILAERSTLTKKQIKAKAKRKDWWLTAEEALKLGFADEVV